MTELPQSLERRIVICARRETVFRYFTDSGRFAQWWGDGSSIDPRAGGRVRIRYPNGVVVEGEVVEIDPPRKIVFTYRYASGVPAGGSLVTIRLDESESGTVLNLRHDFESAKIRDLHVQGWRYQLALFSKVASAEEHSHAAERVDAFLRAWSEPDAGRRRALIESAATADVVFRDSFSATEGIEDFLANVEAVQMHMPGVVLSRGGDVRHCQGTAIAAWTAQAADGSSRSRGTNVYDFAPDGRIARVVGFRET